MLMFQSIHTLTLPAIRLSHTQPQPNETHVSTKFSDVDDVDETSIMSRELFVLFVDVVTVRYVFPVTYISNA